MRKSIEDLEDRIKDTDAGRDVRGRRRKEGILESKVWAGIKTLAGEKGSIQRVEHEIQKKTRSL